MSASAAYLEDVKLQFTKLKTLAEDAVAQVSDEDFDTVLTYLSREYGRVDINRAEPDDIVEVLGLTEQIASSIVAHRKQHGPFENFEALVKVPGVDRDALEKKRDAITF